MLTWRACRAPFADLSGEGARRLGGRWNAPGRAVVYAADSAALALLEVRVHLDLPPDLLPDDYVLLAIDLGEAPIERVETLPPDPTAFGTAWLVDGRTPVLQVPSFIVPEGRNDLINPAHPEARDIAVVRQRPLTFDPRLWQGA